MPPAGFPKLNIDGQLPGSDASRPHSEALLETGELHLLKAL